MKNKTLHYLICCSIFFAVLLSLSNTVYGTNYYVSTTGSNSNTGTSVGLPFLTLAYAVSKVVPGDSIYMRGGTYVTSTTISISGSKSGTSVNMIYLFVYPGDDRPILDYRGMALSSGNRGINLSASYWYIKGIRIRGAGDNGINISGSYNILEYCDFFENRDGGCQLGGGAHDNRIINCDSYHNADFGPGSTTSGGNADGFSPKLDVGTNNYFYGCRSYYNSDDGFDGYLRPSDNITTTLENCWTWHNGYVRLATHDTTTSSMNGNGFKLGGSDGKNLRHNFIVKNCLAFNNKANGFDQNSNVGSITIYNGSSANNGGRNFYLNSSVTFPATSLFTVTNCVSTGTGSTAFRAGTVLNTDQFGLASTNFVSMDTTGVSAPRKADGSLPDITFMHLANGSALIDAGTDVGLPYNGSKPDLGCFETGNSAVQYTLTTGVASGSGTVVPFGATKLLSSNSISVTATPAVGYVFDKWTDIGGATLGTTNPYVASMGAGDLKVNANFITVPKYTLTIGVTNGSGTTSPASGSQIYAGASVTLTATPTYGYTFDKWTDTNGVTLSTSNPYTFVMGSADLTVNVSFNSRPQYTLTTSVISGNGTITPASGTKFYGDTTISIAAIPSTNYAFVVWGGDASGAATPTSLVMNADRNVTASFALIKRNLTITINPASSGTVVPATGTTYDHGSRVKLTATPATGYIFDKWTDNTTATLSTYDTITITMDADKAITGNFKLNTGVNTISTTDNSFNVWRESSGEIRMAFDLSASASVAINLYNTQGAIVYAVPAKIYAAGRYQTGLSAGSLAPGIYLCNLIINGKSATRKLVVE